jgi:hypothetical protein
VNDRLRRVLALGLAAVLIVGVGYGIISSIANSLGPGTAQLHGLIGSEKLPFFQDQRVIAALKRGGFEVSVATAGSRQIAGMDLSAQDFAFPAGGPAAEKIRREHTGTTAVVPFFTPMAIATWAPIVDILKANHLVVDRGGYLAFDVAAYMQLAASDTRWKDLKESAAFAVNKSVLITTTDVRRSNSAAMYLSLTSYVANGDSIVTNAGNLDTIVDRVAPLFLRQGFVENSSEAPFEDYLVQGMGKSPMVMIYESQYIARAAAADGSIAPQNQLIYPEPTIFSKHTFVSLTPNGARLGQFLETDPEMRRLAVQFGFRTSDTAAFQTFVQEHRLSVPTSLIDVIDPPTFETLEALITRLERLYGGETLPPATTSPLITPGTIPTTAPEPPSPIASPAATP